MFVYGFHFLLLELITLIEATLPTAVKLETTYQQLGGYASSRLYLLMLWDSMGGGVPKHTAGLVVS